MGDRAEREKKFHDSVAELTGGECWANKTAAGQLRQDMRAKMAIDFIPVAKDRNILEIGCGNGEFSKRFLSTGAQMHCTDISPKLIDLLREKYKETNLIFEVANVEHLSYPNGFFDGVIGNGILHHLNIDICLKEINRVLKKGGRIFFSEPNMLNPEVFLETNVRWIGRLAQKTEDETAFLRWEIKKKLKDIGFKAVDVTPFDFLQPLTPKSMIDFVSKATKVFEKIPFLREIAGSLKITAKK